MKKIDWKYIFIFAILALGISYPIQQGYLNEIFDILVKNTFLVGSGYLLAGLSTLTAAIIALKLHKSISNRITILGDEKLKNILILSLPIIAFTISGINNNFGINRSLYGLSFALVNTIYAFTEEFGWRRYLQNALEGMNVLKKYILIGVIWWIWHFRFQTQFDLFVFPFICIGGGILLGKLADETKSVLPVVAAHNVIILLTNSGNLSRSETTGIGIIIFGWIVIEYIWKKRKREQ